MSEQVIPLRESIARIEDLFARLKDTAQETIYIESIPVIADLRETLDFMKNTANAALCKTDLCETEEN